MLAANKMKLMKPIGCVQEESTTDVRIGDYTVYEW